MATVRMTAKMIENLTTEAPREEFWDDLVPGLHLRVSGKTGRRTWYVRYRTGGRRRRMKLGRFPALGLADARTNAREVIAAADAGDDPAREREKRRAGDTTFKALAEYVLEQKRGETRETTQVERQRILEADLLPRWGHLEASSVTPDDVADLRNEIAARGAPTMANRAVALTSVIYNVGLSERANRFGISSNPAARINPKKTKRRHRFLERDELARVWQVLETETPTTRGAFRLAILTAQRIGSILALRWDDVDGDLWTIPAEVFKGKRTHLVPLSPLALEVLAELHEDRPCDTWVFPSRSGADAPHIRGLSGKSLQRVRRDSGIPHWTLHDLRRTFRTHATLAVEDGGLGVLPPFADAVLGHKENTLGFGHYTGNQARYLLAQKRDALDAWGEWIAEAVR